MIRFGPPAMGPVLRSSRASRGRAVTAHPWCIYSWGASLELRPHLCTCTSLQPHRLPRSLPSFRPQMGTLDLASSAMQGNIAPNQVTQAAAASALPSLLQLIWACYGPIRWLLQLATKGKAGRTTRFPPLDRTRLGWGILGCCAGIFVAVPFGLARARNNPNTPAIFLAWQVVSVLVAQALQVTRLLVYI